MPSPKLPEVDAYLAAATFAAPLRELRRIARAAGLTETFKWRAPCFTHGPKGGNVVMLGELKAHAVLAFPKGALLDDPAGILVKPGAASRSARRVPFTTAKEVRDLEGTLAPYIAAAIELEESGAKVDFEQDRELDLPAEMASAFSDKPALGAAFHALTLGRQRGYILHVTGAKQSKTRADRIAKCERRIMLGKGFHDCICGRSKRMPNCDGSHKRA